MTRMTVVDGYVPRDDAGPGPLDNLRDEVWSFALDQRAFGPRKLVVAFADADGRFRGIAFTDRVQPFEVPFDCCLQYLGDGAAAAVVFDDAPVDDGEPSEEFLARFAEARVIAAQRGIHLVDWIDCDGDRMRATRLSTMRPADQPDWWDVPLHTGRRLGA